MSNRALSWAWEQRLSLVQKMVLVALADHADGNNRCFPSMARICRRASISERAGQTAVKALEVLALIRREVQEGVRTTYVLAVDDGEPPQEMRGLAPSTPAGDAPLPPQEMRGFDDNPRTTCTRPPQDVHPTPAPRAPEPSITINEPSKQYLQDHRSHAATFDEWWTRYPRKVGRRAAEQAYGVELH